MVGPGSGSGAVGDEGAAPDDRAQVLRELDRLRALARRLSLDDLRSGGWFVQLVGYSLERYAAEVDASALRREHPGSSTEEVISARIRLAARQAGIEGGLSAGAYTGAVAATLGTGGAASPLTLPAAGASFVLDLLYLSHLQLRLAHDIAVLLQVPIDLADPEDVGKLVRVAFAIKGTEAGREAVGKGLPVLVRPIVRRLFRGAGVAAAQSLPVVGRLLLQRNVVKFAVPAVGVPVSMAVNSWSVRVAGDHALTTFRAESVIVEAAREMTAATSHHTELLGVLWLVVKADALIHQNERLLLKHVTALVGDLDRELSAIAGLGSAGGQDPRALWTMLEAATGDLAALYDAGVVAAGIDGKINVNELDALRKLAVCCSVPFDEEAVRRTVAKGAQQP